MRIIQQQQQQNQKYCQQTTTLEIGSRHSAPAVRSTARNIDNNSNMQTVLHGKQSECRDNHPNG